VKVSAFQLFLQVDPLPDVPALQQAAAAVEAARKDVTPAQQLAQVTVQYGALQLSTLGCQMYQPCAMLRQELTLLPCYPGALS
jgi:hypothetical protein